MYKLQGFFWYDHADVLEVGPLFCSSSPRGVTKQNHTTMKDLVCMCASLWMADFFFVFFFL